MFSVCVCLCVCEEGTLLLLLASFSNKSPITGCGNSQTGFQHDFWTFCRVCPAEKMAFGVGTDLGIGGDPKATIYDV